MLLCKQYSVCLVSSQGSSSEVMDQRWLYYIIIHQVHLNLYTWQFWLRKDCILSFKLWYSCRKWSWACMYVLRPCTHEQAFDPVFSMVCCSVCCPPCTMQPVSYQHTVTYLRWHHACTLLNPLAHGFTVECLQPSSTGLQAAIPWEYHEEFAQWWAFSALKCQPHSHVQLLHMTTSCGCAGKFELIDQAYAELNGLGSLWECNAIGDIHWSVNELHVHRKGRTGGIYSYRETGSSASSTALWPWRARS